MTGSGSAPGRIAPRRRLHPVVSVLIVLAIILGLLIATIAITGWYLVNQFPEDPQAAIKTARPPDPNLGIVSADGGTIIGKNRSYHQPCCDGLKRRRAYFRH